jgi:uncharacterized C2H2 Zn-finger protein
MPEKCPYCGKGFANTKALGSHIHYAHESESWVDTSQTRSEAEKEKFDKLFDSCLSDRNLRKPRQVEKIEQAFTEIPEGVSSTVDEYRQAYRCAIRKEKLVKEIEEELLKEEKSKETK